MTFTSSRLSRMPLCLPVRYMPSGMRQPHPAHPGKDGIRNLY